MRENLSARGTLDDWMDASEQALWNAGFERVEIDEHFDRIAADIGENGYLDINFLIQEDGRVRLELDASDSQLLNSFKTSVTQVMQNGCATQPRAHNHYAEAQEPPYNDSYDYDEDDSRGSKGKRGKKGRSGSKGFRLPRGSRSSSPFYSRMWFILLMLILVPPLGIFLMYYYKRFSLFPRILLTVLAVLYMLLIWLGFFGVNTGVNQESINQWTQKAQSQITRFINEHKPAGTSPSAAPSTTASPTPSTKSNSSSGTSSNDTSTTDSTESTDNPIKNIINSLIPSATEEDN